MKWSSGPRTSSGSTASRFWPTCRTTQRKCFDKRTSAAEAGAAMMHWSSNARAAKARGGNSGRAGRAGGHRSPGGQTVGSGARKSWPTRATWRRNAARSCGWIGTSMHAAILARDRGGYGPLIGEDLSQFLQNDVPPTERERLLKMPRDEMLRGTACGCTSSASRGDGRGAANSPWLRRGQPGEGRRAGAGRSRSRSDRQAATTTRRTKADAMKPDVAEPANPQDSPQRRAIAAVAAGRITSRHSLPPARRPGMPRAQVVGPRRRSDPTAPPGRPAACGSAARTAVVPAHPAGCVILHDAHVVLVEVRQLDGPIDRVLDEAELDRPAGFPAPAWR